MSPRTCVAVTRESRRMSRVTSSVTFGVSHGTPSRPDPARPIKYFRGCETLNGQVANARDDLTLEAAAR